MAVRWWPAGWSLQQLTAGLSAEVTNPDAVRVHVHGKLTYLTSRAVIGRIKAAMTSGVLSSDLQHLREALLAEPWIADVTIKRRPPEDLDVFVRERRPVAYWRETGLVDDEGGIFEPAQRPDIRGFKRIDAEPDDVPTALQLATKAEGVIRGVGLQVQAIGTDVLGTWHLTMHGGTSWVLGRSHLEERLRRVADLWPVITRRGRPEYVDARYTNGLAVRYALTTDTHGN
jgi:cell division protein FtsQ